MKIKKNKGLTLVEVIIAVAVISILTATFSSVSTSALKISTSNKKNLQSVVIAENYLEEIRAAREVNASSIKDIGNLKDRLNQPKSWLSNDENSLQFQNDASDSQSIVKNSDTSKGVTYTVRVKQSIVEQDLYEFTVEVSQPNTNTCVLSTRLFVQ